MAYVPANNAASVLAAPLAPGDGSLLVADGGVFPAIGGKSFTLLTLDDGARVEIVKVVGHGAGQGSCAVLRAQEGTQALAWPAGTPVELRLTAGVVRDWVAASAGQGVYGAALRELWAAEPLVLGYLLS